MDNRNDCLTLKENEDTVVSHAMFSLTCCINIVYGLRRGPNASSGGGEVGSAEAVS